MANISNVPFFLLIPDPGLTPKLPQSGGLKRLADVPFPPERGLFCFNSGAVACATNKGLAVLRARETTPRVWLGALPGKVGPVAAPDEESLFTVDRDLVRIRWE